MENNEQLKTIYRTFVANAIVENQKEFAKILETTPSTLSACLKANPKYRGTTDTLIRRAQEILSQRQISIISSSSGDGSGNLHSDVTVNSSDVLLRMISEMQAQREDYTKQLAEEREKSKQIREEDLSTINRLLSILESKLN